MQTPNRALYIYWLIRFIKFIHLSKLYRIRFVLICMEQNPVDLLNCNYIKLCDCIISVKSARVLFILGKCLNIIFRMNIE
jgi:hypothetical protein